MVSRVIILSGPVASGKSSLGSLLADQYGAKIFKTHELIRELKPKVPEERRPLQEAGELLDRTTKGQWVGDALTRLTSVSENLDLIVIDSVRIQKQIHAVRESFGTKVTHVHIFASHQELEKRYKKRQNKFKELPSYDEVKANPTESKVGELERIADVVINTDRNTPEDVLIRVATRLGLCARNINPIVDVLIGGQYGSEGKGNISDHLANEYDYLVRVGGPNAGHKAFAQPKPHTFHHLPSGTQANSNAHLILGPGAVINFEGLWEEIARHKVIAGRLSIDPQAMIISEKDIKEEKKKEEDRGISSTCQGVGAATARKILGRHGDGQPLLAKDIPELKPFIRPSIELFEIAYKEGKKVFLEGTQGTSLSIHHGIYPYVTSRDTTVSGCLAEAGISPRSVRKIIMVCRTYPIRVGGKSGPMQQEIYRSEISRRSGISYGEILKTERTTTTDKPRRMGEFDWGQLHKASLLNGPTDIALSFSDYLSKENRKAHRFEQLTKDTINFVEEVERVSGAPVSLISTRFDYRNIIDRRTWK